MAQYKVIQDIEAEDKLVGNLTLRQFIYAGAGMLLLYLCFVSVTKGVPFLLIALIPPAIFCLFFAFPWGKDQSTEIWALSRIRFYFKPRKRIWDQSGQKNLVTITAPKRIEKQYTNGLSQDEVKSRLSALADTIDSRGWAVKNSSVTMPSLPSFSQEASDRLVSHDPSAPPQSDGFDIKPSDDMLDETYNPLAKQVDSLIQASGQSHRQRIIDQLKAADTPQAGAPAATNQQPAPDYWFLNQATPTPQTKVDPNNVVFANPQIINPGTAAADNSTQPTADEKALADKIKASAASNPVQNMHLKTILPLDQQPPLPPTQQQSPSPTPQQAASQPPSAPQPPADILNLANNNDFDIATIARQANKSKQSDNPDEVVIPLR